MAEDLGHFTPSNCPIVEIDDKAKNIKIKHPMSGDTIMSISTEVAYDMGHELVRAAFNAERKFR